MQKTLEQTKEIQTVKVRVLKQKKAEGAAGFKSEELAALSDYGFKYAGERYFEDLYTENEMSAALRRKKLASRRAAIASLKNMIGECALKNPGFHYSIDASCKVYNELVKCADELYRQYDPTDGNTRIYALKVQKEEKTGREIKNKDMAIAIGVKDYMITRFFENKLKADKHRKIAAAILLYLDAGYDDFFEVMSCYGHNLNICDPAEYVIQGVLKKCHEMGKTINLDVMREILYTQNLAFCEENEDMDVDRF